MALLAGAGMASHLLQLTTGSQHLLPEVFPRVPHIGRFNLSTEAALAILDSADAHLSEMAIPYALALHDDYLADVVTKLENDGLCTSADAKLAGRSLVAKYPAIELATSGSFSADSLGQLNVLRLMRNCTIHSGGLASVSLVTQLASWSATSEAAWIRVARSSPRQLQLNDPIVFAYGEVIMTLAVTKALAREANLLLAGAVRPSSWADELVRDLIERHPGGLRRSEFLRRARGLAKFDYAPIILTDANLLAARARI